MYVLLASDIALCPIILLNKVLEVYQLFNLLALFGVLVANGREVFVVKGRI